MTKRKTDLSAFKKAASKDLLGKAEQVNSVEKKVQQLENIITQASEKPSDVINIVGRPPKKESEKESEIVALKFTKSQKEIIKDRAGDVPLATYLKRLLIENTNLF
jgi:hypothetical protein